MISRFFLRVELSYYYFPLLPHKINPKMCQELYENQQTLFLLLFLVLKMYCYWKTLHNTCLNIPVENPSALFQHLAPPITLCWISGLDKLQSSSLSLDIWSLNEFLIQLLMKPSYVISSIFYSIFLVILHVVESYACDKNRPNN